MPPKRERTKPQATFQVVQQSYEDPEAGNVPKPVLVETNTRTGRILRKSTAPRFMEEMDDADYDMHKLNMNMVDDEDVDRVFDDEDEVDFDNDFIKQIMTGDGVIDSDEEYDVYEDEDQYPKHTERRAIEKQFDRAMDDFDMDDEINQEEIDPRARGALDVMDYAPALEEFVQEQAGASYWNPEEAYRHRGLMNQMRGLATQHRVFDSNQDGHFVVALDPDKGRRMTQYFAEDQQGLKELTLKSIRAGHIDTTDVLCLDDDDEDLVEVEVKRKELHDCETVLSSYTNVYNNPTVLAAQTKKVKLSLAAARKARMDAAEARGMAKHAVEACDMVGPYGKPSVGKRSPAAGPTRIGVVPSKLSASPTAEEEEAAAAAAAAAAEDDLFADLPDEALPTMMDLSSRPKDESKDEKKLRRALVKEMQRERRSEKKSTRKAYKDAGALQQSTVERQKMDKKTIPMSVVRRV